MDGMMDQEVDISIVCPVYNEALVIHQFMAKLFYRIQNLVSSILLPADMGAFELISRKMVDAINQLFMKGIFSRVGFKTATARYVIDNREIEKTRFNFWKLWKLAIVGVIIFSSELLLICVYLGVFTSLMSFLYGCLILTKTLMFSVDLSGYISNVTIVIFLGGIQLIGIGMIGEYRPDIFETKWRPPYIIEGIY